MGRRLCFEALSGIPEVRPGDALAPLIVAALAENDSALGHDSIVVVAQKIQFLRDQAGLLAASLGLTGTTLNHALWGASVGYLFLWSVYWLFKIVTGKEGMGQGDLKLLAALGAWLGWPALLSLVLISSITGALVGIWLKSREKLSPEGYLPFGPFLVFAGLWVMMFGSLPPFQI